MRVLAIAPHTDDIELGCGGTLAKFVDKGYEVWSVAFSTADDLNLEADFRAASDILGVKNVIVYDFPRRIFSTNRQAILQHMIALRSRTNPDLVLIPSLNDIHQDHQVIAKEAQRAFKTIDLLSYELPWNTQQFNAQAFSILQPEHTERKLKALDMYKSQKARYYFEKESVLSTMRYRGMCIQCQYAEAFEVIRCIID